jgi:hypothetical protein
MKLKLTRPLTGPEAREALPQYGFTAFELSQVTDSECLFHIRLIFREPARYNAAL